MSEPQIPVSTLRGVVHDGLVAAAGRIGKFDDVYLADAIKVPVLDKMCAGSRKESILRVLFRLTSAGGQGRMVNTRRGDEP